MKYSLRAFIISTFFTLAAFSAITYTSCKKDKCKEIQCFNFSTCTDGVCICPTGYQGTNCETKNQDRYLGDWNVEEHGSISSEAHYTIAIEQGSPTLNDLVIKNFRNSFTQNVTVSILADTIIIPQQTINGYTVQGRGILTTSTYFGNQSQLTMRYSISYPGTGTDEFGLDFGAASTWSK